MAIDKKFLPFFGPCRGKKLNQDSTYLLFFLFLVRFLFVEDFFQSVFCSALSFFLTLFLARYSPFHMSFSISSFAFLLPFSCLCFYVVSRLFTFFRLARPLLLLLSLSCLFSLKSFRHKLKLK